MSKIQLGDIKFMEQPLLIMIDISPNSRDTPSIHDILLAKD